ncbi:hypothetical protein ABZ829_27800 [Streptomyces xanthochromogenes]|uniref:hypothetical protein n=1 Tax=Streptomyces xanthochromogenes TaxID=67384 RepID=UPI0034495266
MSSQAEDQRRANQAAFWNEKQAKANSDKELAAVWHDACRMLARQADKDGRPPLWGPLAQHLHNFFQQHAG